MNEPDPLERTKQQVEIERVNLREFVMRTPAVLCILRGPRHVFEIANSRYLELVGRRDILGKDVRAALPELEGQGFYELLDTVYATGEAYVGKEIGARIDRGNGKLEQAYFNFTYQPLRDARGKIEGIAVHATEVTEYIEARHELAAALDREKALRAAAQEGEATIRSVFDSMPQLGWIARADGFIDFYNRNWYEYTGTTHEQMEGWGWRSVHDAELLPEIEARWRRSIESGTPFELVFPLRRHDGVFRWFLTRVNPQRDAAGKIVRCVGINTDIDDQRRSEQQLAETLEREQRARAEAERTVRFSELFIGILGHDLRNPLSATLTTAQHLLRRTTDDRIAAPVGRIVSSAERMGRMINQLLDFTRVRIGGGFTLEHRQVQLGELCRRMIDELEPVPAKPRFLLSVVGDGSGRWDEDRLAQVVSNLAANALQHSPADCVVVVAIDGTSEDHVMLTIQNAGAIPPEVAASIFDPFRMAGGPKRTNVRGLGLGLYITQQIVIAHGGTIEIEQSDDPRTVTFCVRLPRRASASPAPTHADATRA